MGATTTRITAADFVTPPDLERRPLAAEPSGRIGGVRLELIASPGGTRLGSCYQQVPLRVLPPLCAGPGRPSLVYLLNPTAGLMDGDAHLVQIDGGSASRAVIVGQSATRIHPSLHGFSTQQWHVRVAPGAVLVVLPGPAIPFVGCRYYQRVAIELAAGASVIWGDVWLAGRYARGAVSEEFRFAMIVQDLTVRRDDELIFRDRFCWNGPWDRETAAWHFGGAPACGSVFASGALPESITGEAAAFRTAAGDTCVRWLGTSEAVTREVVTTALRAAAGVAEPAWLLAGHELGPNHWFSVTR